MSHRVIQVSQWKGLVMVRSSEIGVPWLPGTEFNLWQLHGDRAEGQGWTELPSALQESCTSQLCIPGVELDFPSFPRCFGSRRKTLNASA